MTEFEREELIAYLRRKIDAADLNAAKPDQPEEMRLAFTRCGIRDQRELNLLLAERLKEQQ